MPEEDKNKYTIGEVRRWKYMTWAENYSAYLIAVLVASVSSYYCLPSFLDNCELMDKSFDFSAIIGSFLLTILSILLAMDNNRALAIIKESDRLWAMLLRYNREAVIFSAILCLISVILTARVVDVYNRSTDYQAAFIFIYSFVCLVTLIKAGQFVYLFYRIASLR